MDRNDPFIFLVNFKCFVSSYLQQYLHIECISTCNTKWIEIICLVFGLIILLVSMHYFLIMFITNTGENYFTFTCIGPVTCVLGYIHM